MPTPTCPSTRLDGLQPCHAAGRQPTFSEHVWLPDLASERLGANQSLENVAMHDFEVQLPSRPVHNGQLVRGPVKGLIADC